MILEEEKARLITLLKVYNGLIDDLDFFKRPLIEVNSTVLARSEVIKQLVDMNGSYAFMNETQPKLGKLTR